MGKLQAKLLAGILVMTALFSITLHIMGKSNVALFGKRTFSYRVSQCPMPWSRPNTGIERTIVTPGVSSGTRIML